MKASVQHWERDGRPMTFHRSNGQQCSCGALDLVRETRAALCEDSSRG